MAAVTWLTKNNRNYISSSNIFIYPSAYRDPTIDFKARVSLEENFVVQSRQLNRDYIIKWAGTDLTCILGGYLIKINGVSAADVQDKRWLNIKVNLTGLAGVENTYVIKNWDWELPDGVILDRTETPKSTPSYFIGAVLQQPEKKAHLLQ